MDKALIIILTLFVGLSSELVAAQETPINPFGTAVELMPQGQPDTVSVAAVGPYGKIGVPVIVWNNTSEVIDYPQMLTTVRDGEGRLIAAHDTILTPTQLLPGQWAFDRVPLWNDLPQAPADASYSFEVYATDNDAAQYDGYPDDPPTVTRLQVVSAEVAGAQIIGRAMNTLSESITVGATVKAMCFNSVGAAIELFGGSSEVITPIQPGQEFPFSLEIEGACDRFLVTVSHLKGYP